MKWRHTLALCIAVMLAGSIAVAVVPLFSIGYGTDEQASQPFASGKAGIWAKKADHLPYYHTAAGSDVAMTGLSSAYTTVADEGSGLTQRATINFTGAGVSCVDNSGASRTDCTITSGGGGGTLAADYAAGSSASDQTMLIQSGDGGPVIFKANGAATGALVKAQTSAAAELMSVADNAQAYLAGAAADSGTNKGVVLDTKTALTTSRSYLEVQNGSTAAWKFYDPSAGVHTIEASGGTSAYITGQSGGTLYLSSDASTPGAEMYLDDSTGECRVTSTLVALLSAGGSLQMDASTAELSASGVVSLLSSAADGASAVAAKVDTSSAWSNAAARLLSLKTNAVEKFYVLASGGARFGASSRYLTSGDGTYSPNGSNGVRHYDSILTIVGAGVRPEANGVAMGTNAWSWGEVSARHLISTQAADPTCATGTGAGTGSSCSVTAGSTDLAGKVSVTTAGADQATSATVVTVTFANAYNVTPICWLTPYDTDAQALAAGAQVVFGSGSTTTAVARSGGTALANAVTYEWTYHCAEVQ